MLIYVKGNDANSKSWIENKKNLLTGLVRGNPCEGRGSHDTLPSKRSGRYLVTMEKSSKQEYLE